VTLNVDQTQKLYLLSDEELYEQAVQFMRHFCKEPGHRAIPASQLNGLLNITKTDRYADLKEFIIKQGQRLWPHNKSFIEHFYLRLENQLDILAQLAEKELHLSLQEQAEDFTSSNREEAYLLVAREFIQHLAAENSALEAERKVKEAENKKEKNGKNLQRGFHTTEQRRYNERPK